MYRQKNKAETQIGLFKFMEVRGSIEQSVGLLDLSTALLENIDLLVIMVQASYTFACMIS